MSEMIVRSGDVIAAEILGIKKQVEKTVRGVMLTAAMEIGRLLIEAKAVVPFGEWGKWLEENVDYSQTTANDMMRLYTEYSDHQIPLEGGPTNEELFGALAPSKALALLALPKEERREFVEQNDVEDMSVRQLREEIEQIKAEKKVAEAARDRAIEEVNESDHALKEAEEARDAAEEARDAAEAKLENAEKRRDDAVKAAVSAEREKLQKKLKDTEEKLRKALDREKEKERQLDLLNEKLQEAEESEETEAAESPEVIALREEKARLEKQLLASDPTMAKFSVMLDHYQKVFSDTVSFVLAAEDDDLREKMRDVLKRVHASFADMLEDGNG